MEKKEKEVISINIEDILGEGSGMEFEIVDTKKSDNKKESDSKIVEHTDKK